MPHDCRQRMRPRWPGCVTPMRPAAGDTRAAGQAHVQPVQVPRLGPRLRRTARPGRRRGSRVGLDVSAFGHVLSVDPVTRTARVGGMTTYEDLCDATLRHQLMPLVVPQLKTITLGGAVTGLGIESTSLRSGMPHESVIEMEILTGDGRVVRATEDNEYADLFCGFPNSYGTLGYSPLAHHRTRAGAAVRAPSPLRVRHGGRLHGRDRPDRRGGELSRPPGGFRRRHRVRARRAVPDASGRSATWRPGAATTPASRSTTSRSGATRRISSPSGTTCGAGTPTGSGARGPSACRSR